MHSLSFPLETTGKRQRQSLIIEGGANSRNYLRLVFTAFVLNLLSAFLFIDVVNRPVYDDPYNISDVHNYAANGVSITTLRSQRNPPGPLSFLWMAAAVRLVGGEELRAARLGSVASWIFLTAVVLVAARYSNFPNLWCGALLVTLVFPHSVEATSTVLTEGPALLFAVAGALAWTEFIWQQTADHHATILGLVGGLSIGASIVCRQYNLALLAAAGLLFAYGFRQRKLNSVKRSLWAASAILSLVFATVPVLLLIFVWNGLSSPGMVSGTSYKMWRADVGVNLARPIVATFYVAFYLVPFTFPVIRCVDAARRTRFLLVALLGGVIASHFRSYLLQPGPLHTLVQSASRVPTIQAGLFGLIATLTIYNVLAVGLQLWERRASLLSSPPVVLALLTIILFIVEQLGVGGNIPLYDRYVLQIAPFVGIIAFWLLPGLDLLRLSTLIVLSLVSNAMLWRYAFQA